MKLNSKGFTMVEILAAVAILGIISGAAVISYTKYQEKARNDAYNAMENSAYVAAQNYIQDKGILVKDEPKAIDISTLVNQGYLKPLQDPKVKGDTCYGEVLISKTGASNSGGSGIVLEKYTYTVTINCSGYTSTREDATGNILNGKIFES